ncbi:Oidioi.mRNA.OKI2018_I69.PAR.g10973.t1.cds [Oikopleura dioica]|uniref:Oidioi.mRNA.OKI2018_I69.PAR.g10973.t1.cds n=1 Tax=Oikopleura dioica TaxID=34765 RepID=A0ABN7RZR7_OIKDI|nr:Oidioi.mRNA.OKI2018_I69.PAR.g10973.t1.cds [Oikopleura dioica]
MKITTKTSSYFITGFNLLASGAGLACCLLENFVLEHEPPFSLSEFRKPKILEIAAQSASLFVTFLVILSLIIRKNGFSKVVSAISILDCLLSGGIFIFFMIMFQHV